MAAFQKDETATTEAQVAVAAAAAAAAELDPQGKPLSLSLSLSLCGKYLSPLTTQSCRLNRLGSLLPLPSTPS